MNKETDKLELEHRFGLLKKDFEIMEANIDKTLKEIQADAAKRETRMILAIAGLIVGGIAILGFILN